MTVAAYEQPQPLPASRPGDEHEQGPAGWVARLRAAAEIASYIGGTEFVPEGLRNRPEAIAAAILYGQEIGLEPMQALAKVAVIRGRPTLTAEAMRALIVARGHELWLEESTSTRAIAAGRRHNSDRVGRVTWTLDDAKRAGIAGQPNYTKYPREMLVARATAALARQMFADVVGGLAAAEELEGEPDNGIAPVPELPPPTDAPKPEGRKPTRRQPRPKPADEPEAAREPVAPTPPPDTQPEPETPPEPLATDAYKRRIFATMRDLGFAEGDRDIRLAYVSRVAGREIASSNELTIGEASKVIDQLEADKTARVAGEQALVDRLVSELDGTIVSDEREPAGGAESSTPVPYDEFPEGF